MRTIVVKIVDGMCEEVIAGEPVRVIILDADTEGETAGAAEDPDSGIVIVNGEAFDPRAWQAEVDREYVREAAVVVCGDAEID